MTEQQVKAFLDAVKKEPELQEKINAAQDASAIARIANEAGYVVSVEDIERETQSIACIELDGMRGGAFPPPACMWPASYAGPSTASGSWGC